MPRRYRGSGWDLGGAPLIAAKAESGTLSTTGLTAADDGLLRRVSGRFYMFNGSTLAWENVATDSDRLGGANLAAVRDFAQTTGSRTRGAISDFDAGVQALRWGSMLAPTSTVGLNSQNFSGARAAASAGELVEFAQFQAAIAAAASGVFYKNPVRAVATSNITLSGTQTIDGVALAAGDRVLVAGQSTASANGIYVVASGTWTRATDADQTGEIAPGTTVYVAEGTAEGDKTWGLVGDATITVGTTAQSWGRVGGNGTVYTAGNDGVQVNGAQILARIQSGGGLQIVAGQGLALASGFRGRGVSGVVPSGSTSPVITHNLGTQDVEVVVRAATAGGGLVVGEKVDTDDVATDANNVTLGFATAPTAGQFRYLIFTFG